MDLPGLTGDSLYSPGTVARYQCDEGRVRSGGQEARRCQQDGTWAGHPPSCSKSGLGNITREKNVTKGKIFRITAEIKSFHS